MIYVEKTAVARAKRETLQEMSPTGGEAPTGNAHCGGAVVKTNLFVRRSRELRDLNTFFIMHIVVVLVLFLPNIKNKSSFTTVVYLAKYF